MKFSVNQFTFVFKKIQIVIEHFNISSAVCGIESGLGWEEEEELFDFGDDNGEET